MMVSSRISSMSERSLHDTLPIMPSETNGIPALSSYNVAPKHPLGIIGRSA